MMTAFTNGCLGLVFCTGVSTYLLHWSIATAAYAVLAANLSSFASLMITLHVVKLFPKLTHLLKGILRHWICLFGFYFIFLLTLVPELRSWYPFLVLLAPLAFSTGFSIIGFGPIQDAIVRHEQRKQKALAQMLASRALPNEQPLKG